MKFIYDGRLLTIQINHYYVDRDAIAVNVMSGENMFATLSCLVKDVKLAPDEFVVKTWSENAPLIPYVRDLFIDTGRRVQVGHVPEAYIWRFKSNPKVLVWLCQVFEPEIQEWPVAIFDNEEQATEWLRKKPLAARIAYRLSLVEYRP